MREKIEDAPFLFHVTYYGRLGAIEEDGLVPGRARAIGGKAYDAHARSRVFLTEGEGIRFWFNRAKDHAEHNSDAPLDDGLVPVVLRIDLRKIDESRISNDEPGSGDAKHAAFFYPEAISADAIEVWNGEQWGPIDDMPDATGGVVVSQEDDGDGGSFERQELGGAVVFGEGSPFYPPEAEWFAEYEDEGDEDEEKGEAGGDPT